MTTPQPPDSYPQHPYYEPFEEDSFDFKRYLSLFISNWYWFAIALIISLSVAYGINRWSEEVYTVSSTLMIKDDKLGDISSGVANIFPGAEAYKNQQNLKNEIGILKSYSLNYRVMEELPEFHVVYIAVGKRGFAELRMYKRSPFVVVYDSLEKQSIGVKVGIRILSENRYRLEIDGDRNFEKDLAFGEHFKEMGFDFAIVPRKGYKINYDPDGSNRYYFFFTTPASLANGYRGKLSVAPIEEDASLVTLSTSGYVPEQEADYLNKLMEVYIKFGLEFKNMTASQTMDFIDNQLGTISDSLHIAETNLERFRLVNRLIDISREGSMIQNKLEQIDGERTALLLKRNYYEYLKEYIDSKKESGDIVAPSVMGVSDQILMKMVDELSSLQKQKKQMSMNLHESTEPAKVLEANIINARLAISENISSGILTIDSSLANVNKRMLEVEKEIRKLPSTERQMINIQRKFDINNTVYTFLLEKRAEAGIAKASNVPDNRIIDYAGSYSTSRISPKKKQNYTMAIAFGLMIPILLILLIDYLNNKIIDKKDIEKATKIPIAGYISHNQPGTETPVLQHPGSTLAESFRSVRTNLRFFLRDTNCPVISVTSTVSSEGKTFISANLATIISMGGKKVLLTDLDMRRPRTHRIIGISNDKGLSNFLSGELKFEEVLNQTEIENLWYTPSGPVPPNPAELIDSKRMKDFIEKARKQFDYIILDTPPVAIVTDALLISPATDLYLFVVRQRYSSKNTLELIEELRQSGKVSNAGIILNDISLTGYYGYGLRYGYSAGYGYYYGYNYYGGYLQKKGEYGENAREYYKEE